MYQAKGDYAHLHQQSDKDLEDEVAAATAKVFYDDLLDLDIPYNLFLIRLPDPPDDALRSMLSLNLILFLYLYPVARGLILHWYRSISVSILDKYNRNVFCGMVYAVLKNHPPSDCTLCMPEKFRQHMTPARITSCEIQMAYFL